MGSEAGKAPRDPGTGCATPGPPSPPPAPHAAWALERVRLRASRTRRSAHLAPPRRRWRAAASCSSGSAWGRIPSSPVSSWRAVGLGVAAAAAPVRGARCSVVRVGAGGGPGAAGVQRRSGGWTRRRRGEGVRCPLLLLQPLSRTLSPPPQPPEIARRACRSVNARGGRARLLLPPRRCAARVPTSAEGGRSGSAGGGWCVCGARGPGGTGLGARPAPGGSPGCCSGDLRPAPAFSRNVSPFFYCVFLDGQARFSRLGFPPLPNPELEEPLTPLVWPLPCTPLPGPFLHTSHDQHITGERGVLLGRRSCRETEFCLGSPLLSHAASRRRGRRRPELSREDCNHLAPLRLGYYDLSSWSGGEVKVQQDPLWTQGLEWAL